MVSSKVIVGQNEVIVAHIDMSKTLYPSPSKIHNFVTLFPVVKLHLGCKIYFRLRTRNILTFYFIFYYVIFTVDTI